MADTTDVKYEQLAGSATRRSAEAAGDQSEAARPGGVRRTSAAAPAPGPAAAQSVGDIKRPAQPATPVTAAARQRQAPLVAPDDIPTAETQLLAARRRQMISRRRRAELIGRLSRLAKPTSVTYFILVLTVAAIFELLGLAKEPISAIPVVGVALSGILNWVILVPGIFLLVTVPLYIAQLRIRRINRATEETVAATALLRAEAQITYRRLLPAMQRSGKSGLVSSLNPEAAPGLRARASYGKHLILSQAWVLILEAIPVVSAGPWIILKVIRVMAQQRKEYHAAGIALTTLRETERHIAALERFEIAFLAGNLEAAVVAYQARLASARRARAARLLAEPATPGPLLPAYNAP